LRIFCASRLGCPALLFLRAIIWPSYLGVGIPNPLLARKFYPVPYCGVFGAHVHLNPPPC
jgi:hypothetical protein